MIDALTNIDDFERPLPFVRSCRCQRLNSIGIDEHLSRASRTEELPCDHDVVA
jgi:hypothetical protein